MLWELKKYITVEHPTVKLFPATIFFSFVKILISPRDLEHVESVMDFTDNFLRCFGLID